MDYLKAEIRDEKIGNALTALSKIKKIERFIDDNVISNNLTDRKDEFSKGYCQAIADIVKETGIGHDQEPSLLNKLIR